MALEKASGLSDDEAKELHGNFVVVTMVYIGIAVVAHILMWMWRPWIPGTPSYHSSIQDGASYAYLAITSLLT